MVYLMEEKKMLINNLSFNNKNIDEQLRLQNNKNIKKNLI